MRNAPAIIEIAKENETFKGGAFADSSVSCPNRLRSEVVVRQFKRSWRHTTTCPKVRTVYKIVSTQQNADKYNTYRYVVSPSLHPEYNPHGIQPR